MICHTSKSTLMIFSHGANPTFFKIKAKRLEVQNTRYPSSTTSDNISFFPKPPPQLPKVDDNTPCRTANTTNKVIQSAEHDSMALFIWFYDNQMKANISKSHLLINKKDVVIIRIGNTEIKNIEYEKLLGIKVDTKLNSN